MYKKCFVLCTRRDLNPCPLVWTAECSSLNPIYGSGNTYLCESPWIMKVKYESGNYK